MAYIGSSPTKVVSRQSANIFTYTATANQTAFTGADANGNTLACSPSDLMVHMNGIKLEESDYTATTTTVTLGSGAAVGDEVTITAFLTFESADHYTKSAADTRYVNASGDTMTGNLGIGASPSIPLQVEKAGGGNFVASFQNTTSGTPYGVHIKDAASGANGYPLLQVTNSAGSTAHLKVMSGTVHVLKSSQPSFSVRSNAGNSTNTWTQDNVIKFQTVQHNVGSHYSTSTGRFTAPVNGFYVFHYAGFGYVGGLIAATNTTAVALRVNASTYVMLVYDMKQDGRGYPSSTGSAGLYLTANDYVDVYTSGQGQYADSSNLYTHWSGYLLH